MKINPECMPCLFERAKFECDLAFGEDDIGKLLALVEVAKFASDNIDNDTVPALIGTERGRIISRISGVADPYLELKEESNKAGRRVLPIARDYYESSEDKIFALMKIAAAANSMEYGVRGHSFDEKMFETEFAEILDEKVSGNISSIKRALDRFTKILYILDNAGEVVLDKFVIDELEKLGKKVTVSPKSGPVINDVTAKELKNLGFDDKRIVSSGTFVGVSLEEAQESFLKQLFDPENLVIAKGMGNYETISEFEHRLRGRLIYLFRAKCLSVAQGAGVEKGTLVMTLV